VPLFLWQELRDPPPANPRMDALYREFEAEAWQRQHTVGGWLAAAWRKTSDSLLFYLGLPYLVALAAVPWAWRTPSVRRAAGVALALLASQLVIVPGTPRYLAPGAALFAYLAVEGWRRLRLWRPPGGAARARFPAGRALAAALPFLALAAIPLRLADLRSEPWAWEHRRARLEARLARLGAPQLVLVAYDERTSPHAEWVFNGADLDRTPVLWARSLSPAEDCALVRSLPARTPWRLEVAEEVTPPRLSPFPAATCGAAKGPPAGATAPRPPRSAPAAPRSATAR
jgi:hypothetical protein